jgi:hypothetical protein
MIVDIREHLYARPFVPFTIHVADGRSFHVPTRDHAHVWPSRARVSIYTDEGPEQILPGLLISGITVDTDGSNDLAQQ